MAVAVKWAAGALTVACAIAALAPQARAADGTSFAVGWTMGGTLFDGHLSDYRWDTGPVLHWGVEAGLARGRAGLGARVRRAATTQGTGIPGELRAPRVALTAFELVGRYRVAALGPVGLWGSLHGGRMHAGYDPDRMTFETGGVAGGVTVDYAPIDEWTVGFGAELRAPIRGGLGAALNVERTSFALDTAHRSGDEIVEDREWFSSWTLGVRLTWTAGTR